MYRPAEDVHRPLPAAPDASVAAMGMRELMQALWSERHLLEFLLFKLATAKLILAADLRRFVAPAFAEIEEVLERVRAAERKRAVALERIAAEWDEPVERLSLSYLAGRAPEPASTMLADHRDALYKLAAEIEGTAEDNRTLARSALDHIRRNIDALTGRSGATTYTPAGRVEQGPASGSRWDRAL